MIDKSESNTNQWGECGAGPGEMRPSTTGVKDQAKEART